MLEKYNLRYLKEYGQCLEDNDFETFCRTILTVDKNSDYDIYNIRDIVDELVRRGFNVPEDYFYQAAVEWVLKQTVDEATYSGICWLIAIKYNWQDVLPSNDKHIMAYIKNSKKPYGIWECKKDGKYVICQGGMTLRDVVEGVNYEKPEYLIDYTDEDFIEVW